MMSAILSGPLLFKIIDIATLAAQGVPRAIDMIEAWRGKDNVDLEQLEKDADSILATHNRVQEA